MKTDINPFPISNYISKEYFCNRNNELETLLQNVKNNINTTLISPRRMGKTGLIFRFFEEMKGYSDYETVFVDIYATRNMAEFINNLAEAILIKFPEKNTVGKKFLKVLKSFRASFTYDELTGMPQVNLNYQSEHDKKFTLGKLLQFIDQQTKRVIVAIDEFQQIADYPENHIEALLRTQIQQLTHVNFIFSGSRRHRFTEMFLSSRRPFYQSTQLLNLSKIELSQYKSFIREKFTQARKTISEESLQYIMEWTKGYTFYTQSLCNKLFKYKKITLEKAQTESLKILNENEIAYYQYRKLLTPKQWDFLIAIAKETEVNQIYNKDFLQKYSLGTPSSIDRMIKTLVDKELVLEDFSSGGTTYCIYDVFFMRWLQRTY